ncbi:MAG TPA: thioredoxin family protein [Hyphomicrobiaceae bacterium]|nr:thioredoxin family protein [Hyphomicrobiaceae bacterium]
MAILADGLVVVVKRDCPTCVMVEPVLAELRRVGTPLEVITQDDPAFPEGIPDRVYDEDLRLSFDLDIETVPTLLRLSGGRETARRIGWNRAEWAETAGVSSLGNGLPEQRPGCGAKNVDPGVADELAIRFGRVTFKARTVEIGSFEDDIEACFDRGWSDGLPVVPPTPVRVKRMLEGTRRDPKEVLGDMPPDYRPCTVEKVAINAVMAGCRPEYMPVLLAAVEAVLDDAFCLHGVIATTMYIGPIVIVNGPVRHALDMNYGVNALGQGNRANATIGRALQLTIRNVGGGKPGGIDRATLGSPGKLGFCFAENEEGSVWEPLSVERGVAPGRSAVTLYAGYGMHGIVDQQARTAEQLTESFAAGLNAIYHPKSFPGPDAVLVVSPEHMRLYREAGWSKRRFLDEIDRLTTVDADRILTGLGGMLPGPPLSAKGTRVKKFRPNGFFVVHAGGTAGLFSAILPGWSPGGANSQLVTKVVGD